MMQMVLMVFSAEIVNEEVRVHISKSLCCNSKLFQSSNVFNEAYASPWNTHSELSSYVKILMVRAMAPCTLTAGGIIEINKPMMTSVSLNYYVKKSLELSFSGHKNNIFLLHCDKNRSGYKRIVKTKTLTCSIL